MMFDEIRNSLPPISHGAGRADEFLGRLPEDYRAFLLDHNGGIVDESRYAFSTGVPFRANGVDFPSRDDCAVEFFGIGADGANTARPRDLIRMVTEHEAEDFLPRDVIAIASCVQGSLVCLSLRRHEHGAVYYWDWYWRYPWCKDFFDARVAAALGGFPGSDVVSKDPHHPRRRELIDALNFATLVKLAPSFTGWFKSCADHRGGA